jgi:tetratricopeptide (TPR) repeat protein
MAAADYDRDGRPDLYLCSYIYFQSEDQYRYPVPYHDARNGPPNFLFRNEFTGKAGFFRDATAETGLDENNDRYSFAPAWCDYDGDGWPDLYVANDFGRNNLYRNRGGRFRDVAALAGVEDLGPGMSAAWFDYDGDGRPDLYVANMWTDVGQRVASEGKLEPKDSYRRHTKGNSLYRNRGDGTFEETGAVEGVEMGRWAWAADGFDFDNDGAPEILVTAGMITHGAHDAMSFFWRHVVARSPQSAQPAPDYENGWAALNEAIREDYSWSGNERNLFYVRRGGRYYDFSGVSGLDFAEDGRAFAVTDLDGDGNLDIVLKSRLGPQVRVLRNQCGTGRNVVALRLRGVKSNRDAIGARVEVNGKVQYVGAGSGYLSQHTKTLYFAVGDAAAGKVLVTWPSGTVQEFPELRAGQRHDVIEGESDVKSTPFRPRESWPASPVRGDNTMRLQSIRLMEPAPVPKCLAQGPGAVTVDARSDHETLAAAALLRRYLVDWRSDPELPLTFRLDDRGRLVGMAAGAGTELPASPLPFAGLYYAPPRRNWFRLGAAFYWAGYPEHALPYLFRAAEQSPGNAKSLLAIGQIQLDAGRLEEARTSTERALAIDAALAEAWNNLGGIEMAAGNHKRALGHYEKALSINGDLVYALVNAGQALARLGDDDGAERRFRRALEIRANDADAANQLGLLCARRDRLNEARTWFQRAIECKRDHAGAINNLGVLYMRLGRRDDAIAAYRFGIETAPDDEELYLNLGRIYAGSGEHERARQVMSQLLERRPSSAVARRALQELEAR